MLNLLIELRAVEMLIWAIGFALTAAPIWRVLAGRPRTYDILWALSGAVALMIIGFNLRALASPNSIFVLAGLHVFSILIAGANIWASRSYQRADHG